MAEDFDLQSKTEPPSPRRRERALEEGQAPFSAELITGVVLFAGVGGLLWLGRALGDGLLFQMRLDLAEPPPSELTIGLLQNVFVQKSWQLLAHSGLFIGFLFFTTLAVGLAQVGWHINVNRLAANWERIFPFQIARLVSWSNLLRGLFLLFKIVAVGVVAWWIVKERGPEISALGDGSLGDTNLGSALARGWSLIVHVALGLAGTLFVIGLADYAFQRWRFERSLYMTKQELKEELKREEGNPQIKARIRRLQRETAQRKMFHQVRRASVVVTNPTHLAVALRYESGSMSAPKVVAKGADHVAQRIMAIAREHAIPVVERKSLAQVLYKSVKVDQAIPLGLYLLVAELMAYVYRMKGVVQ